MIGRADIKSLQNARRAQRFPTKFSGVVIADRRPTSVKIADISRVGACVRGANLPVLGTEVVLAARDLEIVATVVWNDGHACGLNFHKPIEPLAVVRRNIAERARSLTPAMAMRA